MCPSLQTLINLTMIPSLVSAGLLEPLDDYMAEVGYKIDMVGNSSHVKRYNSKTYGLPTDGNVFIQLFRMDLFEGPDEQNAFADTYGRPLAWTKTWEAHQDIVTFFHRPDKELIGSDPILVQVGWEPADRQLALVCMGVDGGSAPSPGLRRPRAGARRGQRPGSPWPPQCLG